MSNSHITHAFDDDLKAINDRMNKMAALTRNLLIDAKAAFASGDRAKADTVIAGDKDVDALEHEVNELIVKVIALRQPMAVDLRELISTLKIATYVERVGDYAKNIARRTLLLEGADAGDKARTTLGAMADMAIELFTAVMEARAEKDADKAHIVWAADAELDELHGEAHARILKLMRTDVDTLGDAAHFLMIAKNLERIGDHCTNIAEEIHFHLEGEIPTEKRPKGKRI